MLPPCEARGQDVVLNIFRTGWATQDAAELYGARARAGHSIFSTRKSNSSVNLFSVELGILY